jgi:flavin-dependent dehydrogenase
VAADASPEVVVLGGGPAGCAAASLLARWGHVVVLRTKPSASTPCLAESIPPSTYKLFDLIGLGDAVEAAGFLRSSGNTVWWGERAPRVESFAGPLRGWQVTRQRFESLLVAHAAASGVLIEEARPDTAPITVRPDGFTLDCTGRAGVLARPRGLRVYESTHRIVALTGVWRSERPFAVPDPTHTLIESYEGGWTWSVPETLDSRVIAVMVDPSRSGLARGSSARDVYLREIDRTEAMAALVRAATLVDGPAGWDASMYCSMRYADGNVLLVGDAGSFIDPLSSAGVKKALASGWLAAVAVHTSLRRPAMRDVALTFFDAREAEVYAWMRGLIGRVLADAAASHAHAFWTDRLEGDLTGSDDEALAKAHARIRAEPALRVVKNPAARIEDRPAVSGTEIVLQQRLVSPERRDGVRHAFDVDLIGLVEIAPHYASVPDLWTAYTRQYGPVDLPDFLGALSTAIAQKWLFWV